MKEWIYALVSLLPWPLDKGARWIADRIFNVFADGVRFAKWIRAGVDQWASKMNTLLVGLREVLGETFQTLKWIIVTEIPRRVLVAVRTVTQHAAALVDSMRAALLGLINNVRRFAELGINTAKAAIASLLDWTVARVASLTSNVRALLDRVFSLWGTPARLASWLIAALWTAGLAYLYQQRDRIARWYLDSSAAFTMWLARQLESILARLL